MINLYHTASKILITRNHSVGAIVFGFGFDFGVDFDSNSYYDFDSVFTFFFFRLCFLHDVAPEDEVYPLIQVWQSM
jgi:hypothetical protein